MDWLIRAGESAEAALEILTPHPALAGLVSQLGFELEGVTAALDDDPERHRRMRDRDEALTRQQQVHLEKVLVAANRRLSADKQVGQSETALDQGWLMRFCAGAEAAATDIEQAVWAGLLVAEMRASGSIGRRTLSFVRDMETWELESFTEYGAFAFEFESGWRFMFEEDLARREMWTYGREIDLTSHWIAIGLLAGEALTFDAAAVRGLKVRYRQREWELGPWDGEQQAMSLCCYRKFTPVGQQLASAMKTKSFNGFARNVIQALNADRGMGFREVPAEANS